ncbi:MAG: hypothetical protein GF375_07310 [Candidatus Omnitrophica bacterium]|nr:hypothetical protein [Candidatus Omnitrophota bacterium]
MKKITSIIIIIFLAAPLLYGQDNLSMTACFPNGRYWDGLYALFKEYMNSEELAVMRTEEHLTYYLMGMNHSLMFFVPGIGRDLTRALFMMGYSREEEKVKNTASDIIKGKTYLVSPASDFGYEDLIKKIKEYYGKEENKIIPTVSLAVLARDALENDLSEEVVEQRLGELREKAAELKEQWNAVNKAP